MLHTFSDFNKARYPHLLAFSNWVAEKNDLKDGEMQLFWIKQAYFGQLANTLTQLFAVALGEQATSVLPSELNKPQSCLMLLEELEKAISNSLVQPGMSLMAAQYAPSVAACRKALQVLGQSDSSEINSLLRAYLREVAQHQACANEDEASWEVVSWFLEAQAMALFVEHLGADTVGGFAQKSAGQATSESEQKVLLYGWLCEACQKTDLEQADALADLARYLMLEATYLGLSTPSASINRADLVEALAEMFPAFSLMD